MKKYFFKCYFIQNIDFQDGILFSTLNERNIVNETEI